jgi:Na+-driven multidrug efflux pump
MIGHLGTQQLGAVSLANLAISFATFTFGFLAFLTSPRIGAAYVAGNKQQVSRVAAVGLWLAGGLGLLTTLGMSLMAGPIVGGKHGSFLSNVITWNVNTWAYGPCQYMAAAAFLRIVYTSTSSRCVGGLHARVPLHLEIVV